MPALQLFLKREGLITKRLNNKVAHGSVEIWHKSLFRFANGFLYFWGNICPYVAAVI